MARIKMVTRTVAESAITAIKLNTETLESVPVVIKQPGIYEVGTAETKKLLDRLSDDTFMYVKAIKIEVTEVLYGMPETEFVKYAKVLPPRKAGESETDE